jgi:hypothetical protein
MRSLLISILLLLVITAAWVANTKPAEFLFGINDYFAFYGGAKLLATHQLYDAAAMRGLQARTFGGIMPNVLYIRPPFEAALLLPLASLPYRVSYWCFQGICLLAVIGFICMFRRRVPEIVPLAGVSFPLACAFLNAQDVALVLLAAGAGIVLLRRNRDFAAGLVLALCSTKFHLFGLIAIGFLIHRRWRVVAGGATGLAGLTALSFWAAGPDWPQRFVETLANPSIHPNTLGMGNVYSLAYGIAPVLEWAYVPLLALVIGGFAYLAYKDRSTERMIAYGLIGGLLAGRHAFCQDYALLLISYAVLYESPELVHREWLRWMCLPFLYLGLILQNALSAALPLCLIGLLGWLCWRMRPAIREPLLAT